MNESFNLKLQEWVNDEKRTVEDGCLLLLQLEGNRIHYDNLMRYPYKDKLMKYLLSELSRRLKTRLVKVTHQQVTEMQDKVKAIESEHFSEEKKKEVEEFRKGKRADHDALPDEVQALYVENLSIVQKMRELHLKLRTLSLENATCPDSERYPFLKELIALDKRLHSNWEVYDHYTGEDGEQVLTEDMREQSKNAVRMINLNKNRYAKKPSEELKGKILAWYGQVISPTDKLTNELKDIGILE